MPQAVVLSSPDGQLGKPGKVYYDLHLKSVPKPTPTASQLLVRISAAALNHRDLFSRQGLYPGVEFDIPLLADGVGKVVECGPEIDKAEWLNKRVVVYPMKGWDEAVEGPEQDQVAILGGTKYFKDGTLQEYLLVDSPRQTVPAPEHLSDVEAAALPLAGLTAWRALVTKCDDKNTSDGAAVLITGIGGGVALMAMQFAVARGAIVIVTSGDQAKIEKAKALGALGGVLYKEQGWEKKALQLLASRGKKYFDAVVDGSGADVIAKTPKLLKTGGIIAVYGMTVSPNQSFPMSAVLRNIEVRGSTMGSLKEFRDMIAFVNSTKGAFKPVVSRVIEGFTDLKQLDELFEDMKAGKQFGKLVVKIDGGPERTGEKSHL
ncbi:putative monocarboxylate transporter mch1 [Ascosphaera pollenicola]|nr:putative monocarboxylate transporter mch1 [Ascosphaera pollenicola]